MARTLDQILAEVTAKSDPQRQIVLNQISSLPTQQAADEAGLEAKKTQAYDEILGGARRRGLGFSGIPLGEQAKYAATEYAPAVANLKASYGGRKATLESALADIGRTDYSTAYDMFNQDRTFEEQQRQFNIQAEAARRAAASQPNPFAGLFGGNQQPTNQNDFQAPTLAGGRSKAQAIQAVDSLLAQPAAVIARTWDAILDSANRGNTYDQAKLELLRARLPGWVGAEPKR